MNVHDANHPLWPILRLVVQNGAVILALYLTAHKWDNETLVVLAGMLASGGIEGLTRRFTGTGA